MTDEEQADIVAAAAAEQRDVPATAVEAADLADKYDQMLRLADLFDDAGEQMRAWARLGSEVLTDPDVAGSAALSPATWARAEEELRAATTGKNGLLSRSIELDADALVLRATVLTYRWIDDLQAAAYQTLGTIAGKAIGYLAPQVSLGGAIVAAGLIETDALDRDGVATYLGELAEANPELMEHVTTGGGLVDSLQMRGLLTAGVLAGDDGRSARAGGLRACGVVPLDDDWGAAVRDVGVALPTGPDAAAGTTTTAADAPTGLADLMTTLTGLDADGSDAIHIEQVAPRRLIAFLAGASDPAPAAGRLRLVSGDSGYAGEVLRALTAAAAGSGGFGGDGEGPTHVMLVGRGAGGAAAVELATDSAAWPTGLALEQVVTANAPAALVPHLPADVRVLSLEDRADPVALLGSLINADAPGRLTVVYDASGTTGEPALVAGARTSDHADHPELVASLARWRDLGFLRPA